MSSCLRSIGNDSKVIVDFRAVFEGIGCIFWIIVRKGIKLPKRDCDSRVRIYHHMVPQSLLLYFCSVPECECQFAVYSHSDLLRKRQINDLQSQKMRLDREICSPFFSRWISELCCGTVNGTIAGGFSMHCSRRSRRW